MSQKNDEQCYRGNNFEWNIERWRNTIAKYTNEADSYAIRIRL